MIMFNALLFESPCALFILEKNSQDCAFTFPEICLSFAPSLTAIFDTAETLFFFSI